MDIRAIIRRHQGFIKYGITGVCTVAVDLGLLYVLKSFFGVEVYVAATISFWTSLIVNFSLNKLWTFGARKNTGYHLALYATVIFCNYLVGLGMIAVFQHYGGSYLAGKVASLVLTTAWNFFIYKYVIFLTEDRLINRHWQTVINRLMAR